MKSSFLSVVIVSIVLTTGCGGSGGGAGTAASTNASTAASPSTGPTSAPTTLAATINGSATAFTVPTAAIAGVTSYPTVVYVPADYTTTTDLLPVIYITDGVPNAGSSELPPFEFSDVCRILEDQHIRAVVVGVTGQNRDTDYLMPGAATFYKFVTEELMPFVETKYRIDPTKRTLSGHSYGGLFAGYALNMERPDRRYFSNFIMEDGSFWYQPDVMIAEEKNLFTAFGGTLPGIKVVLSSSTLGNDPYVQSYYSNLLSLNFSGLYITNIPAFQTTHFDMFDNGFSASVSVIFPSPPS